MTAKRMTDADAERLRGIARKCNYDLAAVARRVRVKTSTVWDWSRKGWLTPPGQTVQAARRSLRRWRLLDAMHRHHGDLAAAARELGITPHGLRCGLNDAKFFAAKWQELAQPRRCAECGAEFKSTNSKRTLCSLDCRRVRERRLSSVRYRLVRGRDPYELRRRDINEPLFREMLWRTFGQVARAARLIGCSPQNVHDSIRRWNMRHYVEICRASAYDPERLQEILQNNGWHFGRSAKSCGWGYQRLKEMIHKSGALHLSTHAPCPHCGCMTDKRGATRPRYCGDACRRAAGAAYAKRRREMLKGAAQ